MKIVFIGAVEFSKAMLEELIAQGVGLAGVITCEKTDRHDDFCDLTQICINNEISYHKTVDANSSTTIKWLQSKDVDLVLCCGWSRLLMTNFLSVPKFGVIGYHPSLLPKNRGRHPIIWTLALGLPETASTFFLMDEGADTGDIVSQVTVPVGCDDTARDLYEKLVKCARAQLIEVVGKIKNGSLERRTQNLKEASAWRKRNRNDGEIDWRMSDRVIYNLVRALSEPYCGAHFVFDGRDVKVRRCKVVEILNVEDREPGFVVAVYNERKIVVKCGEGVVEVEIYHPLERVVKGVYL